MCAAGGRGPRAGRTPARALLLALWVVTGLFAYGRFEDASAQVRMRGVEAELLREAAALESQGDYEGAEQTLRRLLRDNPASSGGIFALDRVLRVQGRAIDILPVVGSFLAENPEASGVRSLELRVLADADSTEAVRRRAEAWFEVARGSEVPYREAAKLYERLLGVEAALEVLQLGRSAVGRPDALALEIGDLLAARGDPEGAADEWASAIARDPAQIAMVVRRVRGLGEGRARAGERLVMRLAETDGVAARRAGARIALDLRLADRALPLAQEVAAELDGRARTTFLADVARRAQEYDLEQVASWAYDALAEDAATPAERRQFDQRIIDVALASGDTAAALDAQRRLAASFPVGSVDRRRASAQVVRLQGSSADPAELRSLLMEFREEFPNAPELDDLAATVAGTLQARGDAGAATAVLEGVNGPRSALERAYVHLANGEIGAGRDALLLAVTGLPPAEATPVIELAALLGRISEPGAEALAAAGVAAHRGRAAEGARALAERVGSLEPGEQAPVLAQAARLASDGGAPAVAAEIRRRIVEEHPDSPELGEASLALARFHARTPDGVDEAIRLLEALITQRPNAAVVPDARLELQKLRGRGAR